MKIVIAYKWAPNPQDATVAPNGTVDFGRAKPSISEYDPQAFEVGRRLADASGAELIGLTVGSADAASSMAKKAALSRGLDRLVVVTDPGLAGAGATQTGLALAAAVESIGDVDLVLAGDSSVDAGTQMVPAVLAGALGWPALAQVTSISGQSGALSIQRNYAGGSQTLAASGPVVCSVASDATTPRIPGMKDILGAAKKPSEEIAAASLPAPALVETQVVATAKPQLKARRGEVFTDADPDVASAKLLSALKAANVL